VCLPFTRGTMKARLESLGFLDQVDWKESEVGQLKWSSLEPWVSEKWVWKPS